MEAISRSLLTFLVNALWQIPLIAIVAAGATFILRKAPAGHRLAVWVAALIAAILLPVSSLTRGEPSDLVRIPAALDSQAVARPPLATPVAPPPAIIYPVQPSRTFSLAATTTTLLAAAYLLFLLFQVVRLARASLQTVRIRRGAMLRELPPHLDRVHLHCLEVFQLPRVELVFSPEISGPVTAGRAIILPESLLDEPSEDVLTTAIGHEMAHIVRRDFLCNVLYELLFLPVSFHPAAWWMRRNIELAREMACDELVTQRLMDADTYAQSIVNIAAAMTALPRPGYTLGVFDGNDLEARIRRLMEPVVHLKQARLRLAGALAALALCAVIGSSLSFSARAQGTVAGLIKQGQDALKSGDSATAMARLEEATRFEPNNVEARVLFAQALLAAPNPSKAEEQLREALRLDPLNKQAIHGMIVLKTGTAKPAEALEWVRKAIQIDNTDASAYYTAGVLDWKSVYPDYMSARKAAGMQPQDPGIIPDAALRNQVRAQHMAQIEDGHRMLQTALQIVPDYSDAMAYINLLYRIQAGIANNDAESRECVTSADEWVGKALAAKKKQAQSGTRNAVSEPWVIAPPPPPPPPAPGSPLARTFIPGEGGGQRIQVAAEAQARKLRKQVNPVYPDAARQAGVSGTVILVVVIGRDGAVRSIDVARTPSPALVPPAMDAVRQWLYEPTLIGGQSVEVMTTVDVTF